MKKFKQTWEITKNWQLIFPIIGILALLYFGYRFSFLITGNLHISITIVFALVLAYIMLKVTLWLFKKLENKWIVKQRWEMIRIFMVFAITGSASAFIGRPIIKLIGITKENLNPVVYWILFVIIGLVFYQILLVTLGWLFGQHEFFWNFEKKMMKRMGFKRFFKE